MGIRIILTLGLLLAVNGSSAVPSVAQPQPSQHYESFFLYLGNYPDEAENAWAEEAQGITTDGSRWFITQRWELWSIPITADLVSVSASDPYVDYIDLDDVPALNDYNHAGDLDFYEYEGQGYLVIPLEGDGIDIPAIAIFDADNLEYIDHAELHATSGVRIPWCAIDGAGHLHMSNSDWVAVHYEYSIDWDTVSRDGNLILDLEGYPVVLPFLDEAGNPLQMYVVQGGEFSESGDLLYVTAGDEEDYQTNSGINVFETQTWRRVRHSSVYDMPFKYEYHPGWDRYEEPEGLAIYNLDDGRAPGIAGSLHVLLLDNPENDIYLKHYTESIYVDASHVGEPEDGTPGSPFDSVAEAYDMAWDGQRIRIRAGSYPETPTFSKRLQILAIDGPVTIGE